MATLSWGYLPQRGTPVVCGGCPRPSRGPSGLPSGELSPVFGSSFVAPSRGFVTRVAVPLQMPGEPEKFQGGKRRAVPYLPHEAPRAS